MIYMWKISLVSSVHTIGTVQGRNEHALCQSCCKDAFELLLDECVLLYKN